MGPFAMIRPTMVHQFPIPEQPQHTQPQQPMNGNFNFFQLSLFWIQEDLFWSLSLSVILLFLDK